MGPNWLTSCLDESSRVWDEDLLAVALKGLLFLFSPPPMPPLCPMTPSPGAKFQTELFLHFICIGLLSLSRYCSCAGLELDLFKWCAGKMFHKWLSGKERALACSVYRFPRYKKPLTMANFRLPMGCHWSQKVMCTVGSREPAWAGISRLQHTLGLWEQTVWCWAHTVGFQELLFQQHLYWEDEQENRGQREAAV